MISFMSYPTITFIRFIDSNSDKLDIQEILMASQNGVTSFLSAMDYQTKFDPKTEQLERVREEAFAICREIPLIDVRRNMEIRNLFPNQDSLP